MRFRLPLPALFGSNFVIRIEYRVYYINKEGVKHTYQPDFLINEEEIVEIKNSYSIELEETKIKEQAFRNQFPDIKYKILIETDLF